MSLRSPLGYVLGHGSAREGVHHWWHLRTTSAALAVLGIWFVFAVLTLPDLGRASVAAWLGKPFSAVLMMLFVFTTVWHSLLGLQVVVEDYVRGKGARVLVLVLLRFVHVLAGAAALFAVLKLALGGKA
ncbi:MAG TPA: succinate dehydrogenase, hydrophobic membrane anchor protein [Steroidobacteraceae bacterium]|jgi:succinate dehydrogenase membrane anchor subunit|nr:succinate dehydrogenase, hydrophobic membrane anchor protein [Steroidobacteraceae bacterium]